MYAETTSHGMAIEGPNPHRGEASPAAQAGQDIRKIIIFDPTPGWVCTKQSFPRCEIGVWIVQANEGLILDTQQAIIKGGLFGKRKEEQLLWLSNKRRLKRLLRRSP